MNFDNAPIEVTYKYFKHQERLLNGLSFSRALEALELGLAISRRGWHKQGMFVMLHEYNLMPIGRLLLIHDNTLTIGFQWTPSTADLLAKDWEVSLHD